MSNSNQEIIEARLATYVDGELDPAERVEIEAHLEQNPQYQRLVEELRKGREMLRCLPRETAPVELGEAFASQLERSVLLDGGAEKNVPRMRIGAWPRVFAAAAIVTLAFGLGIIVVFVLPGHGKNVATNVVVPIPKSLTTHGTIDTDQGKSTVTDDKRASEDKTARKEAAERSTAKRLASKTNDTAREVANSNATSGLVPAEMSKLGKVTDESVANEERAKKLAAGGGPGYGGTGQDAVARNGSNDYRRSSLRRSSEEDRKRDLDELARDAAADPQVMTLLSALPEEKPVADNDKRAGEHALVIVVRSNDPAQVQQALTQWCEDNRISLQPARKQVFAFGGQAARAGGAARSEGQGGLKGAGLDRAEKDKLKALGDVAPLQQKAQKKTEALAEGTDHPARDPGRGQAHPVESPKPGNIAPAAPAAPRSPAVAKGATAHDGNDAAISPAPTTTAGQPAPPTASAAPEPAKSQVEKEDEGRRQKDAKGEQLYFVARGVSRHDAKDLNAWLARKGDVSQADVSRDGKNKQDNAASGAAANLALADKSLGHVPTTLPFAQASREAGKVQGDGNAGPKTRPADEFIQRGDQLRLTYAADKEGKEQAETVVVSQDGTIDPQVLSPAKGKVQAAGKTVSEVERALQENGTRQAADGATTRPADPANPVAPTAGAPPVKVKVLSQDDDVLRTGEVAGNKPTAPMTRAVEVLEANALNEDRERRLATTAPAVAADAPSSQPVADPAAAEFESVDVVIVLRSDAAPALNKIESPASATTSVEQRSAVPVAKPATQPAVPAPETPSDPAK